MNLQWTRYHKLHAYNHPRWIDMPLMFGLVLIRFFNAVSIFNVYLMPKASLLKESSGTI